MNMTELAQRLKSLRIERGLTLEDVAGGAGLTRSWLSKVENFRVTPSLPALSSIARVLDVSMADLFEGLDEKPPIVIVHKDERRLIRRDEDLSTLRYESLAHTRTVREMDPFVVTVPVGDDRPRMTHSGEEFVFVLEGAIGLEFDDESHTLDEGDSAYFDGSHPHRLACHSDRPARVLIVYRDPAGSPRTDAAV